ncbi:MAG: LysE family translocator [Acidimicrobiia bacterium]
MIDTHRLLAFVISSFALIVIPGPSVLFVVSRAISLGRKAAIVTVVGNALGTSLQLLFVAAGLGSLVTKSIVVFTTVKLVGAVYLVYLGVQAFRHRHDLTAVFDDPSIAKPTSVVLREGFVVGAMNPKVIAFFAAVLPQFVDRDLGHVPLQMIVLGLIFEAIALVSDSTWGIAAGTARQWLARKPGRLAQISGAGGVAIIGLGVRLALTGRNE